jgi:hypothetical protein
MLSGCARNSQARFEAPSPAKIQQFQAFAGSPASVLAQIYRQGLVWKTLVCGCDENIRPKIGKK